MINKRRRFRIRKDAGFLFYASIVEVDGEAYAFAAKSGIGKSTHTELWMEHPGVAKKNYK